MKPPYETPLAEWSRGWLVLECASVLGWAAYIIATDDEKREKGVPVTDDEMRDFLAKVSSQEFTK